MTALSKTTQAAIRDEYARRMGLLTPTLRAEYVFRKAQDDFALESLVNGDPAYVRRFDWDLDSTSGEVLTHHGFDADEVRQTLEYIVTYPATMRLYGDGGLDDLQKLIDADAIQIANLLESPSYWLAGHNLARCSWSVEDSSDQPRKRGFYLLRGRVVVQFYRARALA